ncbi:MAG: hypothetical protein ABI193_22165 [Minicystis sp.]
MTDLDVAPIVALLRALRADGTQAQREPHPKAAGLLLPDRSPAPAVLRAWAAFDNRYPEPSAGRRGSLPIANAAGKVAAKPMKSILREVCIESIREELEGDRETLKYLRELVAGFTLEFPGYGVMLDPGETPDRVLWFGPEGPLLLWYEDDAFARRESFSAWVVGLWSETLPASLPDQPPHT